MSGDRAPVRSYQRIFSPERRIHQVEGHRVPVPGGVPLRWLGYATATLLAFIALSARSSLLSVLLAFGAALVALALGARTGAITAGVAVFGASQLLGAMLVSIDWPMRLLVGPALIATLATQATPDGRAAHRYAWSRLALELRPQRHSLGRPLPDAPARHAQRARVAVASDEHGSLRRGRVHGPATAQFNVAVLVAERRGRRRRRRALASDAGESTVVEVAAGERLDVCR